MATGRGGKSVKTKLGFLTYGEQGTWKSSFCLGSMKLVNEDGKPFKVLYIDAEAGSVDTYLDKYEEEGFNLQNIYIVYTQSLSEVKDFIQKARDGEEFYVYDEDTGEETDEVYLDGEGNPFKPDMIVVDGVSLLYIAKQQSQLEFSKKRSTVRATQKELTGMAREVAIEGSGIEIKDYQTMKFEGQNLILDLLACGKHFAVTMRETDEKESYKDKNGEIKSMATGRKQPEGFKDVRYNVKTVLRMFKDDDGSIKALVEGKDRTLVAEQDTIIDEPCITLWQSVIDKNKNKKDFSPQNTLQKSVEIEMRAIEKENAKFDTALQNEKEEATKVSLSSVDDYKNEIKRVASNLSDLDRSKRKTLAAKAGLPSSFSKITDIDKLQKYLGIVNGTITEDMI